MAKASINFPKDSCPISEARRSVCLTYLRESCKLEMSELWSEAFEKVANKTFQIPYWKTFLNASLPSADASEVTEAIGVILKDQSKIPNNAKRRGYGILFPVQNTFIVPQLPKNAMLIVMTKTQIKTVLEDPEGQDTFYFYNFIADLYNSAEKYLSWVSTTERELMATKIKNAVHQLDDQSHEDTEVPAIFTQIFRDCGVLIIDDNEFDKDIENISDYAFQGWQTQQDFVNDTKGLPLYSNLWKKPRGAEWKKLLYKTHWLIKMAGPVKATASANVVKESLFSEKQLERALAFLKDQYNPDWKAVLASPHDGLCEDLVPTFWKRTKLFAEYLTWTDLLWKRIINGQAYNKRLELTENFPEMSQFSHCLFLSNASLSSYSAYTKMSCKIPYKFPRRVLMTSYSDTRSYELKSSGTSANNPLPGNIYRFPIGSTCWGPEDELIAGSYETINDQLTSSMLKTCEGLESKYKQAMRAVTKAYRIVTNTEQSDIKEHILQMLSDYELSEASLGMGDLVSLY